MTVDQMRQFVRNVYPTDGWWNKVAKMSDNQIIAIYSKWLESGKFKDTHATVSFPRHAGRDLMMANKIIAVDLALGEDVTVVRKRGDSASEKRDGARSAWAFGDTLKDGFVAKQVTFDDVLK